jgi:hypothetical protein
MTAARLPLSASAPGPGALTHFGHAILIELDTSAEGPARNRSERA